MTCPDLDWLILSTPEKIMTCHDVVFTLGDITVTQLISILKIES